MHTPNVQWLNCPVGTKAANASREEQVREAERREIACELHDTVIQPLASLLVSLECVQRQSLAPGMVEAYLGAWKELAQEAMDSLRCTLAGGRTHPHAELGLPDALLRHLAPQVRSRGLRLTLESRDWPRDVPLDHTSSLYLVVREALTNVSKHARASEVAVLLGADADNLRIIITDNGVGMRQEEVERARPATNGTGFGIGNMRDRIQTIGGQLILFTALGSGVRVEITVPRPRYSVELREMTDSNLANADTASAQYAQ
jgi:signal transduction histidine kinase